MTNIANRGNRTTTPKRRLYVWPLRIVLGLLLCTLLILAVGFIYQSIAITKDARAFPAPGKMVDVGGYHLHVQIMGKEQDGPTVILENGGMGIVPQWGWVQPEVAKFAQVVAYDRPGTGWSEAPPQPLDAEGSVRALRRALEQADVKGPYLRVVRKSRV